MDKTASWEKYRDIIDLPHHVSPTRTPMGLVGRGAQFSAFAALSGFDGAIKETGRLTDSRPELTDEAKDELNLALKLTLEMGCAAAITYFVQDEKKLGGRLETITGKIKGADRHRGLLIMQSGAPIPLNDICDIQPE